MQLLKVYVGKKFLRMLVVDYAKHHDQCRSLCIRLDSDSKCGEALLTQLSARLASGHITDKYVLTIGVILFR